MQAAAREVPLDRTVPPIPQPAYPAVTELDARNVKPPPFFEVKAPDDAPNVLIVLTDDMGFGQSSAFGGPVHMPTVEALANEGVRFNEFHTTALCSPGRTALLSGRNHLMNNMDSITETATEGADVGLSTGTPVLSDYTNPFIFNGKIEKVAIDLKEDKATTADKDAIEKADGDSRFKRALAH